MKIIKTLLISLFAIGAASAVPVENMRADVVKSVKAKKIEAREYRAVFNGAKLAALKGKLDPSYAGLGFKTDSSRAEIRYFKEKRNVPDFDAQLRSFHANGAALIASCKSRAKQHLAALGPEAQFDAVDVEYTEGIAVGTRVSRVSIRYCRRFRGALVRDNFSYAYVNYDGDGSLAGADIRWPEFKIAPGERVEAQTSPEESYYYLAGQLADPMKDEGSGRKVMPVAARVKGFEPGWVPIEENGGITLTPTYSYSSQIDLDDGGQINRLVDFPLLRRRTP